MRLDQALVERGLAPSRARAQSLIREGHISINGKIVRKPSITPGQHAHVEVSTDAHDYVSRGALKLVGALKTFAVNPQDKTCLDLGASTGGFTDSLLRHGARTIYAVDVGHGQLAESILADERVINCEGTHARDLSPELIPEKIDLFVCDVSFISIMKALPPALTLAAERSDLITLVKPQYELGRDAIGKKGRVLPSLDEQINFITTKITPHFESLGWSQQGSLIESPICGGEGTVEFLFHAQKTPQ